MSGEFYKAFKANMDELGMPAPDSLFATLSTASATIVGITEAIAKGGAASSLSSLTPRLLGAFGRVGPGAFVAGAQAAAIGELAAIAGGVLASAYLGACVGSLMVAAWQAYGVDAYGKISATLTRVAKVLKTDIRKLLENSMRQYAPLAPLRLSVTMAGQMQRPNSHCALA